MTVPIVLYDACVLFPAPLRDLLMHLALTDLFRAKWSAQIHDEWIRNVLKTRSDLKRGQLEKTRTLMDAHVRDSLVTDYESLIDTIALPDEDDRHVVAAAIKSQANLIITYNLKDFPASTLQTYNIEAQHPDTFVSNLIQATPSEVCLAVKRHRASLKNPPKDVNGYLATLEQQRLLATVGRLSTYSDIL